MDTLPGQQEPLACHLTSHAESLSLLPCGRSGTLLPGVSKLCAGGISGGSLSTTHPDSHPDSHPGSDEPKGPMSHTLPPGSPAGNRKSHTLTSCDFEAATSPAWICHSGLNSSRMFWKQSLFFAFPSCFMKCRKHSIKTCIVTQTPLAKQVTGGGGGQQLLASRPAFKSRSPGGWP